MKQRFGLKLAVVAALALPMAAQAALQYTPPQAMVLTCGGSAPNVLNKTSALATFACANGAVPQAVGITSGLGNMLGLASGASLLVGSEAVPHLALPAASGSGGSGSGGNGTGNGSGSGNTGSNTGSNGSGSGGNGSGNGSGSGNTGSNTGPSGSASGSSANASGNGGGFWGHLVHSVGRVAQQIGNTVLTGGQATVPLFGGTTTGNSGAGAGAGAASMGGGVPASGGSGLFGGGSGGYHVQIISHYPAAGGTLSLLFAGTHNHSNQNSLWWLVHREMGYGGKLPYRYVVSMNRPMLLAGKVVKTGPGYAFCAGASGGNSDNLGLGQFEALKCRVEQNGQLAVFSSNNAVQFTVPSGKFSYAYTNLSGSNPNYFMQYTTGELRRTAGYVFPAQYLRANASFAKLASWVRVFSSCVAGPVVHYRGNVPMIFQMPTYITRPIAPPAQINLNSTAMPSASQTPVYHAPTPAEVAAANTSCFGYMGYSPLALRSAGVVQTSAAMGYATPEVLENGVWVASPYRARVVWTGPSRDNANIMQYVREALTADSVVGNKTLAEWGIPARPTVVMGSSPMQ
ncbi:hypothetical protein [Acidithiobacillus ferriphilus]|uniref:hypothetical protein n=1 Tax=Acidithiobacillus ferriphilus TaxID=1689834 RepID=UPI001C06B71F|nr:hypothetical protein [Acidithiobacillus ferriphilus]MBU2832999.1 hypothetical protein [Acidithiobacillus ferriphilus]